MSASNCLHRSLFLLVLLAACPAPAQTSHVAHEQFKWAHELLRRGDRQLAAQAFEKFLVRFPEDDKSPDALYFRGFIAHLDGDNTLAASYLSRVANTQIVPDHLVDLLRGKVATDLGNHAEAVRHLDGIDLQKLSEKIRAEVWLTRAACHQRLQKLLPALDALKHASKVESPLRARALLYLAGLQEQLGRRDEAIGSLQQCLALEDVKLVPEAARRLGELHYEEGRHGQAIEQYRRVVRDHPGSPEFGRAVVALLWALFKSGQHEAVLETWGRHKEALKGENAVEALYLAGSSYEEQGKYTQAAARFEAILVRARGWKLEDRTLYKLAVCYFKLGRYGQMGAMIDRLRAAHPDTPYQNDADLILARARAEEGDVDQAAALYSDVIRTGARHRRYAEALRQRAWLFEKHKQLEHAIRDYRRYLEERLAPEPAIAQETALRLVDLYARTQQFAESARQATDLLGAGGSDGAEGLKPSVEQEVLYRWALASRKLGKNDDVHEALSTLLKRHPLNPFRTDALYFDGLALITLGRADEGVSVLREALASKELDAKRRIDALRLSALHLRKKERDDDAVKLLLELDTLSKGEGLQPGERQWLGRALYGQEKYAAAIGFLEPLLDPALDAAPPVQAEVLLFMARSHRGLDQKEAAIEAYSRVIAMALDGFDLLAWTEKAETLVAAGQHEAALEEYHGLINVPQTRIAAEATHRIALVHRAMAVQFARENDMERVTAANREARKMLLRTIILHSDPKLSPTPELAHLDLAEVEMTLGEPARALEVYEELVQKFPDGPYATFARSKQYLAVHRRAQARAMLGRLNEQKLDRRLSRRVRRELEAMEQRP